MGSGQELAEAVELAGRSFRRLHQCTGRGPDYYTKRFPEEVDLQVVGVAGSRVVGIALGSLSRDGATTVVGEVAVDPVHRRQGVGRAMLAELEARATARGLELLAVGGDEELAGFYVTCGWEPRVQATIRGAGRRAVLDRLRARELEDREVREEEQEGVLRAWIAVDGYDGALADQLSAVDGCSAFEMFTKTLPSSFAPSG